MRLLTLLLICLSTVSCIQKDDARTISETKAFRHLEEVAVDSTRIARCIAANHLSKEVARDVFKAYASNKWKSIWTDSTGLNQQARLAAAFFWNYLSIGVIDSARFLPGMHPVFDALIENGHMNTKMGIVDDLEVVFTCQFVRFYHELLKTKSPGSIGQLEWYIPVKKHEIDWPLLFTQLGFFESRLMHAQFNRLVKAMEQLLAIEKAGGWQPISFKGENLIPGDSSIYIPLIKKRLQITEVNAPQDNDEFFHQKLAFAVKRYRTSVGLKDTALIDAAFINQINISVEKRIRTLTINLNRWKWLPPDTSAKLIRVNIPAFELEVLEKGKSMKRMNAIIGTNKNHTVMFYDQIRCIVFSPYWNIPKSILAKELWPHMAHNLNYLQKNDLEIVNDGRVLDPRRISWHRYNGYTFPYLVRQKPGVNNPLGQVKFLFPNPYSIYIHDTPNKALFEKQQRAFSHGCIRISDPRWLAGWLLNYQEGWNPSKIDTAMVSGKEVYVDLTEPVPVYITYFTSWVNDQGILQFRDDVYGHDAQMEKELFVNSPSK